MQMQLHEPSLGWNPRNQTRHPRIAKRSEDAGSLEGKSESEEESATKAKSRGTTAKRGVQFQKLPDGK
jgi:hypothetical protein